MSTDARPLAPGARVRHARRGLGTVTGLDEMDATGGTVWVKFDGEDDPEMVSAHLLTPDETRPEWVATVEAALRPLGAEAREHDGESWVSVPLGYLEAAEIDRVPEDGTFSVTQRRWSPDGGLASEQALGSYPDPDGAIIRARLAVAEDAAHTVQIEASMAGWDQP